MLMLVRDTMTDPEGYLHLYFSRELESGFQQGFFTGNIFSAISEGIIFPSVTILKPHFACRCI